MKGLGCGCTHLDLPDGPGMLTIPDDPAVPPSWETFLAALVILIAFESIQQ